MHHPLERLLLVSERAERHEFLGTVLREHASGPLDIRCCASVEAAADAAARSSPQALLLDLCGSHGEPAAALASLRASFPDVPVVLLASGTREAEAAPLLGQGADDYVLEEHATSSLLMRTLRAAVERARERRERQGVPPSETAERDRLLTLAGRVGRIGGWSIELATGTVRWSDEVCAIHEAPAGTSVSLAEGISYFAPEWRSLIEEHVRACALDGTPYDLELEKVTFKGRRVWVRTIGEAVRAPDGTITHIQGAFQDITAQRRSHEMQLESERRYRMLFEQSLDGVLLTAPSGRILAANPAICAMLGYSEDEIRALSRDAVVDPADPRLATALAQWRGSGRVVAELTFIRRDGSRFPVEVSYLSLNDVDGEVRASMFVRDISDRKRAEAALANAEAHYRFLVENAPYAIYALDVEGGFIELNPAGERILEVPAVDLLGVRFSAVIAPSSGDVVVDAFERVISGREDDIEFEARIRRPSGEERLLRVTGSAIREAGAIVGVHGIARDITDEVERERSLRRAQRLASVGTLIGGVAHELNNPLHAVRSFADLMLMDPRSELDRESLQIIRREADRAAGVVSDLRQLARETQADSQQGSVDVNELVRHVVKVRRYALDTSNIELHEELEADLPRVLAVRGDLEQVVLNLVVNAEQAMREGPRDRRLVLRTRRTPDGVAIDVLDTGVGIPSHHVERIYDPFFTTKDPGEGTGLGLSLVHSIVREHGGEIRVASDPGWGTHFRVDLPRGAAGADHARAPKARRGSTTGGLRVLVVDDEAAIREVTARFLRRRGHRVDAAAEGGEALEKLAAAPYDVLVSDLRMPGIDGEALLQGLRALDPARRPKMVIVTGDIDGSRSVAATSHPGVPVLIKPVRLQELAEVVERIGAAVEVFPEP